MFVGNSPRNPHLDSVNSSNESKLFNNQSGNVPPMFSFPANDSRLSDFNPVHVSGIGPTKSFLFSKPLSPRYNTSKRLSSPMDFGNGPCNPLAERSMCRSSLRRPNFSDSVPVMRLPESTKLCRRVILNKSSGKSPVNKLSLRSTYRSSWT